MIDVHTFIGGYPFRHIPHPDPEVLVRVLSRERLDGAWVSLLPSAFYRDPIPGNDVLYAALAPHAGVLRPVPIIRPDWPGWERAIAHAVDAGAPAVRAHPPQWGMGADDPAMRRLAAACGDAGLALSLVVRFEDLRQRHWMDGAADLSAAAIRAIARGNTRTRIVVSAAGRETIEEVHWGLTPAERQLVWWDFSWIWGPPEDELAHLFTTIGADRFVYGTGWPLRLTQNPRANLALLPDPSLANDLADAGKW
jgi:predicted TIM-barrel fold metal-dependent hydrolase